MGISTTVKNISGNAATATSAAACTGNASTVTTLTTTQVLNATAAVTVGAVGSYAFLGCITTLSTTAGGTLAGSNLVYIGISSTDFLSVTGLANNPSNISPAGTWRCMGVANQQSSYLGGSLWLRIL